MRTRDFEAPPDRRRILASRERRRTRRREADATTRAWRRFLSDRQTNDPLPVIRVVFEEATAPATAEVLEELQRAMKASRAARSACVNRAHVHDTHLLVTGEMVGEPVAMLCWGENCGAPAHHDLAMNIVCHDDPDTRACDFADPNFVNPCTPKE